MKSVIDIVSKYQKYFLGLAIFLSFASVSVTISQGEINLNLRNYPVVMISLVAISIILALIYIEIDRQKIRSLSNQLKAAALQDNDDLQSLLDQLTFRQKEVYDLIVDGKTNKEIMSLLYIEQSTLKTHINQLYKKLNIKSRKELKSLQRN